MRISGGGARGIPLTVPKGDLVRPATDGLRQAGFQEREIAGIMGENWLRFFERSFGPAEASPKPGAARG